MKKYIPLVALVCVALLVVGSVAPAVAKGAKAKGAVNQFVLGIRIDDEDPNAKGTGGDVGRAMANTTDDGQLIANVHLDSGNPNDNFVITVWYNYGTGIKSDSTGTLSTNGKGKGNGHVAVSGIPAILPGPPTDIQVQIVLWNTARTICYSSDFFAVPAKK